MIKSLTKVALIGAVFASIACAPLANAQPGPHGPQVDQLCNNPAYAHAHPDVCADATPPADWDD